MKRSTCATAFRRAVMSHRSWIAAVVALLAMPGVIATAARAQTPQPSENDTLRLALDDAIDRALTYGEEMQAAQSTLAAAHAALVQARSSALPQLQFSLDYTRQLESIFEDAMPKIEPFEADTNASDRERIRALEKALPDAGLSALGQLFSATSFASVNTWAATLALSQTVFEGGLLWHSISGARHAMRSAGMSEEDSRRAIILSVREAYLGALLADRGLRIAQLTLAQAETQLQRVRVRANVGEVSEFDLLQAEVARDNQKPVVLRAQTFREIAYLEVERLANLPSGRPLVLTSPILEDAAIPADPAAAVDTTGLVGQALAGPGIVALQEAREAREHAIPVAASSRWPALSLFASYSEQAYPGDVFPTQDEWFKDVRAGAQLSWSLFDGFRTHGAIQQAKVDRSRAGQVLQQSRELVREATLQNEGDLERAAAELQARSRTVQLASRAYELASLRYDEGAGDLLEVGDARLALQVAQSNEAQARHDYFVALARLERYSGQPVFSSIAPEAE